MIGRHIHRKIYWGMAVCLILAGTLHMVVADDSDIIKKVPTTHKVVALTFDDGPNLETTLKLLNVLREKQVKATFFVLGMNAERHLNIVGQAVADGHEIASHAYSHKRLNRIPIAECEAEFDQAEAVICKVAPKPVLFRPPDNAYNDEIVKLARLRGYTTVLWSVDPGDWHRPSVEHVVKITLNNIKPGSIVLMHDGQNSLPTPQAVGIIIDRLREQGYQLVTVSELLQYYEVRH